MGYVEKDKPDIFLSYARRDDQVVEGPIGWVTEFSRKLQAFLDMKVGSACELFMDHQLATGSNLNAALEAKVRASAVLVMALSPSYLQ
jgi:hypothetical protein